MPGVGGKEKQLRTRKRKLITFRSLNAKMILVAEFERAGATQWPSNLFPLKEPVC